MYGGANGGGTLFKMNTDGTGFTTLYSFTDSPIDGFAAAPYGPLVLYKDALYGTASGSPLGTVFRINTDGQAQSILHIFSGGLDGDSPLGGVILSGNTLYGTTSSGGAVFKVNTDGTGFAILHCLSCETNSRGDDTAMFGGLALAGGFLYGTTMGGGAHYSGTVFKLGTDGSGFTNLHEFNGDDGSRPVASLLLSSNTLYGTTWESTNGGGTVFAINTDGTAFRVLHMFAGGDEGAWPIAALIASGNTLYGTTYGVTWVKGGNGVQNGTVFAMNMDGTDFRTLYSFTGGNDGAGPAVGVTLSGNALYGTTTVAGVYSNGTVFRLSLPVAPTAAIVRSQANLVVALPTNSGTLTLQSSTNLLEWFPVAPTSLVNGQYTVTNMSSRSHQFFRLSR